MNTTLAQMETVFRALGDQTRLRILGLLLTGDVCVCHIHESLKIPQPKTSRHLAYLRKAGLVSARRDGFWMHYRIADLPDAVLQTVQQTVAHVLGHLDVVQRDVERLRKATGCAPLADCQQTFACCAPFPAARQRRSRNVPDVVHDL